MAGTGEGQSDTATPQSCQESQEFQKSTLPLHFTFLLKTSGRLGTYAAANIAEHLAHGHGATATDGYEHRQPRDLVSASSVFAKGRIRSQKCQNG